MDEIVTLKKNKEFKRIYFRGKSCVSSVIVTYAIKNRKNITRVCSGGRKTAGGYIWRYEENMSDEELDRALAELSE